MDSKVPFKLKDVYTPELIKEYGALLKQIHPSFPAVILINGKEMAEGIFTLSV